MTHPHTLIRPAVGQAWIPRSNKNKGGVIGILSVMESGEVTFYRPLGRHGGYMSAESLRANYRLWESRAPTSGEGG